MDTQRVFLAIVISFGLIFLYQYAFVGLEPPQPTVQEVTTKTSLQDGEGDIAQGTNSSSNTIQRTQPIETPAVPVQYPRDPKEVSVDTPLYTAKFTEDGGMMTSFVLKKYKETKIEDSAGVELVVTTAKQGFPLGFSWGSIAAPHTLYTSSEHNIILKEGDDKKKVVTLTATTQDGMQITRIYTFYSDTYLIDLSIQVSNNSGSLLQGTPTLSLINSKGNSKKANSSADRFLFAGASAYIDGKLHELKPDEFAEAPVTLNGLISWAGYENNYFLCTMLPLNGIGQSYTMKGDGVLVQAALSGGLATLKQGESAQYDYKIYYGPKKLSLLKKLGYNLDKALSFGWFTMIAKPMLWLLNMFYAIFRNYGIAIILVTIVIKGIFWPISQKGMKSMKNMQKLQPKMAKIKEKYKDDPQAQQREVMSLYKTYKVNPLGGCLPMFIQIPFFFALYRVLLQSIELRQAPFIFWINDLAAPDRLFPELGLPYLGGIPVLTILMGASMWLQQKMTPTTADPTQAKVMMFLPLLFTFMFLNFPAGLVLYWLVNNLLSILQQVLINKDRKGNKEDKDKQDSAVELAK